MTAPAPHAPHAVFAHRDFIRFQFARFLSTVGTQVASVAVGWQVYDLTHRKLDLGYVGLAQFAPALGLSLVTGAVADRYDRKRVAALCHLVIALCFVALFAIARSRPATAHPIYAVLLVFGTARAFLGPSNQAMLPSLVPPEMFGTAMAWGASIWQVAAVSGPALGGLLWGPLREGVFALSALCSLASMGFVLALNPRPAPPAAPRRVSWDDLLAGVRYVWRTKLVLGTVTLDLFAVLFGGAVALLPVFARDILHTDAWGMGMLRSAPAAGAAAMALWLAYHPLERRAGRTMLLCVALFGAATVVFGLSENFALSLVALTVTGAVDMVSVVVRQHAVQLATPDAMRGRVSAVNLVFVSTSNELGEFESGLTAEWFGPVRAVVGGGLATIAVVALWAWRFPVLRKLDSLNDLRHDAGGEGAP